MNNLFNRQTDNKCIKKTVIKKPKVIKELKIKKEVKKYNIWSINAYKYCGKKFISDKVVELELSELLEALETDNGYHMRINSSDNYIFYGDCDGFKPFQKKIKKSKGNDNTLDKFEEFAQLLISFLSEHYQIKLDMNDISYTSNESKPGYYHYSVSKIYGSAKKLMEIHEYFQVYDKGFTYVNDNGKQQTVVDSSIYTTKWFRYPNQTKEFVPGTEHVIKHGKMIDFVVEYIPSDSICIDNKKYNMLDKLSIDNLSVFSRSELKQYDKISIKNTNQCDDDFSDSNNIDTDIEEKKIKVTKKMFKKEIILGNNIEDENSVECDETKDYRLIDPESKHAHDKQNIYAQILSRLNLYDDENHWVRIGMALRNESNPDDELFDIWDKWSQQSETKYEGTTKTKKKWDGFILKIRGFHVNWLLDLIKKHRPINVISEKPTEDELR